MYHVTIKIEICDVLWRRSFFIESADEIKSFAIKDKPHWVHLKIDKVKTTDLSSILSEYDKVFPIGEIQYKEHIVKCSTRWDFSDKKYEFEAYDQHGHTEK